jgi:hypothetical protein
LEVKKMVNLIKSGYKKMIEENKNCFDTFSKSVKNSSYDRRYSLKLLAGTCTFSSCIVEYRKTRYYCYLTYEGGKIKEYNVEIDRR